MTHTNLPTGDLEHMLAMIHRWNQVSNGLTALHSWLRYVAEHKEALTPAQRRDLLATLSVALHDQYEATADPGTDLCQLAALLHELGCELYEGTTEDVFSLVVRLTEHLTYHDTTWTVVSYGKAEHAEPTPTPFRSRLIADFVRAYEDDRDAAAIVSGEPIVFVIEERGGPGDPGERWVQFLLRSGLRIVAGPTSTIAEDLVHRELMILEDVRLELGLDIQDYDAVPVFVATLPSFVCERIIINTLTGRIVEMADLKP